MQAATVSATPFKVTEGGFKTGATASFIPKGKLAGLNDKELFPDLDAEDEKGSPDSQRKRTHNTDESQNIAVMKS